MRVRTKGLSDEFRLIPATAVLVLGCATGSPPVKTPPAAALASTTDPAPANSQQTSANPTLSSPAHETAEVTSAASVPPGSPEKSPPGTARERLMRSHFKETEIVRSAVIRGTLADALAPAEALSRMEGLGEVQPSWSAPLASLRAASLRMSQSPDIPGAAAAMADIGVACGSCHRIAGGPKVKPGEAPAVSSALASRMQRHIWATERLWEGIYVPSDASWRIGSAALVDDPFPKELLDKGGVHARSAAARFLSIAATVGGEKKLEERAKLYASLLETCSSCHVAVGGQSQSPRNGSTM